ncbi:hypothetical protein Tco_1425869 [Tanacetum coccineum]
MPTPITTTTVTTTIALEPSSSRPQLTSHILYVLTPQQTEARVIKLSKPELIKVVVEVASEAGADPKALRNMKGGKEFLKNMMLNSKSFKENTWRSSGREMSKRRKDLIIIIIVYKNNDPRNFDVHKNFKFSNFGISEWGELSVIIPKKRNKVVRKLMTSLSNKYKRPKEISGELGINPSLPLPGQDPSLPLSRKRKAI